MPNNLNLGYRIENSDPESFVRVKGFSKSEGSLLSENPGELIAYNGSAHLMTVAPTGTGKGRSVVVPTLLTYPGSVVVMDPKGENYAITARARSEMGQQVIRLNPFDVLGSATDAFNFFDLFKLPNIDVETESQLLAELIASGNKGGKEPFWDLSAGMLLAGVFGYIVTRFPHSKRKIGEINKLLTGDARQNLSTMLQTFGQELPKAAYHQISAFLALPKENTAPSVQATASAYFAPFFSKEVEEVLDTSDFSILDFRNGNPISIYIVIPPDKLDSHRALIRLWVGVLLRTITSRETIPDLETLFILDEVGQLGSFNYLYSIVTLCRGYGLKCWTIWQDFQQLEYNYQGSWQTLMNNCGVLQFFGSKNYQVARKIEEITGVPASAVRAMKPEEQLLVLDGFAKVARKLDYLTDDLYRGRFDPNPFYARKRKPLV